MQHLGEICWAQRSRGKCGRNAYCVKARRDFQTAGLNGVFGYFCRRGQKYPAPGRGISLWTIPPSTLRVDTSLCTREALEFRACGRGGAMHPKGTCFAAWASPPTYRLPKAYAYPSGRTESSAPTHVYRKIMRPPSGGSFHLIACSSPSNTGALKNSPSVMSSPSQSILMVSSLGF